MCGFYRRFIPNFAKVARPLTSLTHKNAQFAWTPERQSAFETLRDALTSDNVLAFPDITKPFELWCDASTSAIGGVLCQQTPEGHTKPVFFISQQLSTPQQKWSTIERELYAIIFSLDKVRSIIYGFPITVYSDHAPLSFIRSSQMKNPKLQRWALRLEDYGAKICHVKGKLNTVADFLSRFVFPKASEDTYCNVINTDHTHRVQATSDDDSESLSSPDSIDSNKSSDLNPDQLLSNMPLDMSVLQRQDTKLESLVSLLFETPDHPTVSNYTLIDNVLYFLDDEERLRLVLPKAMLPQVIKEAHEGFLGAHLGARKTYRTLCRKYYCHGMWAATFKFIQSCHTCASTNTRRQHVPIQEVPIPPYPFHTIAIDVCGPFPQSASDNKYVITVQDLLTNFIEATCSPNKSAASIASFLINEIIPRHSCPSILLSDNGTNIHKYLTD